MERPNTMAAKRAELVKVRKGLESDLRAVTSDMDHLDAAIRLFDPATTPEARKRYAKKHWAKKGHLKRFVLTSPRRRPRRSRRAITEAWIASRGLRTDVATFVLLRKRVGRA